MSLWYARVVPALCFRMHATQPSEDREHSSEAWSGTRAIRGRGRTHRRRSHPGRDNIPHADRLRHREAVVRNACGFDGLVFICDVRVEDDAKARALVELLDSMAASLNLEIAVCVEGLCRMSCVLVLLPGTLACFRLR